MHLVAVLNFKLLMLTVKFISKITFNVNNYRPILGFKRGKNEMKAGMS